MKPAICKVQVRKAFYCRATIRYRPSHVVRNPTETADGERPPRPCERACVVQLPLAYDHLWNCGIARISVDKRLDGEVQVGRQVEVVMVRDSDTAIATR